MISREKALQLLYTHQPRIPCHHGLLCCQRDEAVELGSAHSMQRYEVKQSNTSMYLVETFVFPIFWP
jgi:hypothetical protein